MPTLMLRLGMEFESRLLSCVFYDLVFPSSCIDNIETSFSLFLLEYIEPTLKWSVTNDFKQPQKQNISWHPDSVRIYRKPCLLFKHSSFWFPFSPHILLGCLYLWCSTYPWWLISCLALSWWSANAEIVIHSDMLTDSKD